MICFVMTTKTYETQKFHREVSKLLSSNVENMGCLASLDVVMAANFTS